MHGSLNIWQILWQSGFVIKIVLILLAMSSVLSWTIIFQKYKELKSIVQANEKFNLFFKSSNSLAEINREASENHDSTMSLMFRRGYEELNKVGEKLSSGSKGTIAQHFTQHGFQALERALKTGHNAANEKMDIRVSTLASIGSITPFIGPLGQFGELLMPFLDSLLAEEVLKLWLQVLQRPSWLQLLVLQLLFLPFGFLIFSIIKSLE